jgi:hypothetical protein
MLNLFYKKTQNTKPELSKLDFFSMQNTSNDNNEGDIRHYSPATKE